MRTTTGHFTFADWQERVIGPGEDANPRLAHGSVRNTFTGGIEAAGTHCEYAIVYVTAKTGSFSGMELLTGGVDGREGSFAVEERGSSTTTEPCAEPSRWCRAREAGSCRA
jgi:hypothetical protein